MFSKKTSENPTNLEAIVSVTDLKKTYDSLVAVDGVSFEIRRGEVFGLLGPNGAGKTTTISVLSGILPATSGIVKVTGNSGDGKTSSLAMRQSLGVVPQDLAIYLKLTARENLEFFGTLYGMHGAALTERVNALLEMVGLADRADDRAADYSGGMKRRLNLAVGLVHNPEILLLDEPTVGVDPQSRNHIFEGVRTLNKQGLTVLYTSHYMEEVEALCDRVGIMDRGKLIACDTVANLIATQGGSVIEAQIGAADSQAALKSRIADIEFVKDIELTQAISEVGAPGSEENPNTVRVRTEAPGKVLSALVGVLSAANCPLYSLNLREPNLEDVFLELTGKTLRD